MRWSKPLIVAVLSIVVLSMAAFAGESQSGFSFGAEFFAASTPCPARELPTFESIVPVPGLFDPFEQDALTMFCQVHLTREGKDVRGVKGKHTTELVVRDNDTGELESFPVGSGKFRTKSGGKAVFEFDLPAELFADGFESGDVSAWSYTRTDFTNRKRVSQAQADCSTSTSKTGG